MLDFPGRNNRQTDEDVATIGNQKESMLVLLAIGGGKTKSILTIIEAYTTCYTLLEGNKGTHQ